MEAASSWPTSRSGWEPESYYCRWAGFPLSDAQLNDLKGLAVRMLTLQTDRSDEMLGHFRILLDDPAYIDRICRTTGCSGPRSTKRSPNGLDLAQATLRAQGQHDDVPQIDVESLRPLARRHVALSSWRVTDRYRGRVRREVAP
ncbi:MAG: hypothetical protein AAGA48_19335 [Myxococcota bacterium]